jgi:hypothetical protein
MCEIGGVEELRREKEKKKKKKRKLKKRERRVCVRERERGRSCVYNAIKSLAVTAAGVGREGGERERRDLSFGGPRKENGCGRRGGGWDTGFPWAEGADGREGQG